MRIAPDELINVTSQIFAAAGCSEEEANRVGRHLVEANLVGHDSHGVIRIKPYIEWLRDGLVVPNQTIEVVFENDVMAVVDGCSGFGQSIGEQAVQMGIDKCSKYGVSAIALRHVGHLGRIGDWPQMAAEAGKFSLHYVNTSGKGLLVAPFGGIERRMSANPIAAGVPVDGRDPIVLDISACMIAEGKIKVALNKGVQLPEGCIIDAKGNPSTDPGTFYSDPGAILPFGAHKGYGLGIIAEMMAGALTGGDCTNPKNADRLHNGMLSIYLDPSFFADKTELQAEIKRFIDYVKTSAPVTPDGDILMPGEIEARNRTDRTANGIELDDNTWQQIVETASGLGIEV
ncbi:MAG: malate/lactate/ureidoglycolate dehydrogenase [Planctomycetaceae bacterium]|nr:malate/lactate/ureidoglycolate dehydrogenase [Planctomycetaceae bacterium]